MVSKIYPAVIVTLMGIVLIGVVDFFFKGWDLRWWRQPVGLEPVATELATVSPTAPPKATPSPSPAPTPSAIAQAISTPESKLRISNQTEYPIRVALLAQDNSQSGYKQPFHWDFAPEEGSQEGLILSLPEASLQLQEGDILVAFAQDGSRRYWGPYVVGHTDLPIWNSQQQEWYLTLTPSP
jgi:hypothetical protein